MFSLRTAVALSGLLVALPAYAQTGAPSGAPPAAPAAAAQPATSGVTPPPGYVIGPDDVLDVIFWKDEQSSSKDVPVRPDGKVSLTVLNEMHAAGLTPEQFRAEVIKEAGKYFTDPTVSVNIKAINSRRVYITGQVTKPNAYALGQPLTVSQLIAMAGGLQEYTKGKGILIVRTNADGNTTSFKFNYDEFRRAKNLKQDIQLMPGDRIIVP